MKGRKRIERSFTKLKNLNTLIDIYRTRPNKIVYKYFADDRSLISLTYSEFADMICRQAAGFASLGLAGKRIAVIGETSPMWVSTYISAILAGGIVIPLDKELKISEIEGFLEFSEADAVVFSQTFNDRFTDAAESHKTLKKFIPLTPEGCTITDSEKVVSFDEIIKLGEKALSEGYTIPCERDMERLAVMLFTSGTTGTSKCVMLCEKNVIAAVNSAIESVEFTEEDVIVSVLPIHHTYELCIMISATALGMEIGINDSLRHLLKNFQTFKPTGLILVPLFITTMNKRILDTAKKNKKEKLLKVSLKASYALRHVGIDVRKNLFKSVLDAFGGRLNKIISGGAPLNPSLVHEFDEFGINICEGYGITECSPLISVSPYYAVKPGSVGPAVESCRVRIAPVSENAEPQINAKGFVEGEIQVKGDNVMLGYYKNEQATAEAFTKDGWYCTGDIGYLDNDGYIFITGRKKSVIVLENGKNVFPEEIEEYLADVESIAESVVVGRKSESGLEIILTAIVYPNF
ncbi:MAG: AMP-binding protein, partial [Clostridia bacterium]|nr:AMP-binding protein [Clostridia bacterium]